MPCVSSGVEHLEGTSPQHVAWAWVSAAAQGAHRPCGGEGPEEAKLNHTQVTEPGLNPVKNTPLVSALK